MSQTVLAVIAEVEAASVDLLRDRVRNWRAQAIDRPPDGQPGRQFGLYAAMPTLHFMSLSVFDDPHWDPLLVFESNFDGDPDAYWQEVDSNLAAELRPILACTKDAQAPEYTAVFRPGSNLAIAPFLKAHTVRPVAYHVGNVGLTADRIRREQALMLAVRDIVDRPTPELRGASPVAIHASLRAMVVPQFPWLATPESRRSPPHARARALLRSGGAAAVAALAGLALAIVAWPEARPWIVGSLAAIAALLGASFAALTIRLRHLERTDFVQDAPPPRPDEADIALRENLVVQNHLASMVMVKPGALRAMLIRLGTMVLGFKVLAQTPDGYLGQMRTIHFAHWSLVGNGSRLLFLSNYDGSWESYLNDFIDKAASGLTLAWSNCVGFPRTRWLMQGGATDGLRFKAWARHSQRESLFWYSAYPDLTVNQIEHNTSLAAGLRQPALSAQEAELWVKLV